MEVANHKCLPSLKKAKETMTSYTRWSQTVHEEKSAETVSFVGNESRRQLLKTRNQSLSD